MARPGGMVALVFRVLSATVYRRLLFFATDLSQSHFEADPHCRWLRADEAEAYCALNAALTTNEVRHRLREGMRCWVVETANGTIAHALWVVTGSAWIKYIDQSLSLAPGEAYLFQSFTAVAERGQRHATRALRALKHELWREGVRRTLSCVLPERAIAYPPVFRAGAAPIAYIGWFGVGPWRRHFRRPTNRLPWYAPRPIPEPPAA